MNVQRAVRSNRIYSRTLHWAARLTQVLEQLGYQDQTPSEQGLAQAISTWQRQNGLSGDGILGPRTWGKLEPTTRYNVGTPKASPIPPPAPPPPRVARRGKLLVSEGDITAGALKANDAYDLALYELSDGNYEIALFMKIQFFFKDSSLGQWASGEKLAFMRNWKVQVAAAWNTRNLHRTKNGKTVSMTVNFEMQEGGWMLDHWEVEVTKINAGGFSQSTVTPRMGNVKLDSEDTTAVEKYPSAHPGVRQVGAAHEFGHMLGLDDEYTPTSRHRTDSSSIMGSGAAVRSRHMIGPRTWAISKLKSYGIE